LPEHLELDLKEGPVQGERAPGAPQILFYPSGDSSGGSLRLRMEARNEVISVDWLSGRVQRGAAPVEDKLDNKERAHKPEKDEGDADE
jgi:general secretion pathway protein H